MLNVLVFLSKYVFIFFLFFVFLPTPVSAAVTVENPPLSVSADESFQVLVHLRIGSSAGNSYYLRPMFSHSSTPTSYFGSIKNHLDAWYNGEPSIDYKQYKKVTMNEFNAWDGVVEIKASSGSSGYKGSGTYTFRLGYYTDGGSLSSTSDRSALAQMTITGSAASPTPTPTSSPSPSPSPSPTPSSSPTPTVSPSVSPSLKTSPKPSPTPIKSGPTPSPKVLGVAKTATPSALPTGGSSPAPKEDKLVLGQTTAASPSPQPEPAKGFAGNTILAFGLMGLGLVLILFSAYTFLKPRSSDTMNLG